MLVQRAQRERQVQRVLLAAPERLAHLAELVVEAQSDHREQPGRLVVRVAQVSVVAQVPPAPLVPRVRMVRQVEVVPLDQPVLLVRRQPVELVQQALQVEPVLPVRLVALVLLALQVAPATMETWVLRRPVTQALSVLQAQPVVPLVRPVRLDQQAKLAPLVRPAKLVRKLSVRWEFWAALEVREGQVRPAPLVRPVRPALPVQLVTSEPAPSEYSAALAAPEQLEPPVLPVQLQVPVALVRSARSALLAPPERAVLVVQLEAPAPLELREEPEPRVALDRSSALVQNLFRSCRLFVRLFFLPLASRAPRSTWKFASTMQLSEL